MEKKEKLKIIKENIIKEVEKIEDEIDSLYVKYGIERGDIVSGEIGEKLKKLKSQFTHKTHKIKKINKQLREV